MPLRLDAVAWLRLARLGIWSVIAFVLNLTWEIFHVRFYTLWETVDGYQLAWSLIHCTLGDALIALVVFIVAGMVLKCSDWPRTHPLAGGLLVVSGTMAYTAWSEWFNVYRLGSWGYTESMPLIFGVGLSPLLQWLVLPPLMIIVFRKLAPSLLDRNNCGSRLSWKKPWFTPVIRDGDTRTKSFMEDVC